MEREFFLRGKMYELHFFIVKLIVTFSSSVLAFSIGMLALFEGQNNIKNDFLITIGWFCNIFSIGLIIIGLMLGLSLTYDYYNNIIRGNEEINEETARKETKIHTLIICSAFFALLGVIFILVFIYINLLK